MKSHSSKALPESLTAFMILPNSNVDANQRISILSSATSNNAESASTLTNEQMMDSVTYDPIASVLCQRDSQKHPLLIQFMQIRLHLLDQGGIEPNVLLSRLRNLRNNLAVKLVAFRVTGTPITLLMEH